MFDTMESAPQEALPTVDRMDARDVAACASALTGLAREVSDAERIDQIRSLENLKAGAAAAQARVIADLYASQRAAHASAGLPAQLQGKGVANQVALARRESPVRGSQHLGLAKALVHEMPHTLQALTSGRLSEWRATLLVRETACLTLEDRRTIDRILAADPERLEGLGDRALIAEAKKLAYRLDPESVVRRRRKAESERRVTCRPAPDTMANLTALLPAAQAIAAFASLTREADARRAAGDCRSRGQVMADTLVQRLTGQATANAVSVEVSLVVTDRTLLRGDDEPAHLDGYGPVPADMARTWTRSDEAAVWLRRLYTHPATGQLIGMESDRRFFPAGLGGLIRARDQICRTPWCNAPIRHIDHVQPRAAGGPTSYANGQGQCEQCNYAKEAPGWRSRPSPTADRHAVTVISPTGHTYRSTAPPLPGAPPEPHSKCEFFFTDLIAAA